MGNLSLKYNRINSHYDIPWKILQERHCDPNLQIVFNCEVYYYIKNFRPKNLIYI